MKLITDDGKDLVFESVRVLGLKEGDIICFRLGNVCSDVAHMRLLKSMNEIFPGHQCVILEPRDSIEILRKVGANG